MAKSTITPCPHRRRFDLCGCHIAAIVLERLTWWWRRGTAVKNGVEWRVKPREQLAEETGLTLMQVRRALEKMKARNLVETSQHKWMGRNFMHYRLLPRAMILLNGTGLDEPISEAISTPQNQGSELGNFAPLQDHMAGMGTKNSLTSSNEEVQEFLVANAALAFSKKGFSGQEVPDTENPTMFLPKINKNPPAPGPKMPKAGMTAAEIIAQKSKTGAWPGKKAPKAATTLGEIWQEAMALAYPGMVHTPLTLMQHGQLKQLAKKLPAGSVEQAIRSVVADWVGFVFSATSEAGAFALPNKPVVGVVLKFASVAANFEPTKPPVAKGNPAPKPPKVPAQLIAQTPKPSVGVEDVLSKDDIAEALKGVGKKD